MKNDSRDLAAPKRTAAGESASDSFSRAQDRDGMFGGDRLTANRGTSREIVIETKVAASRAVVETTTVETAVTVQPNDRDPIIVNPLKKKKAKKEAASTTKPKEGKPSRNIIAALDIGSSKICCFIAEVKSHGTIDIIGIGHQASRGLKNGTINDLRAAETAVAHAVEAAETMARGPLEGQPITSVVVNVPGVHCLAHHAHADVKITGPEVGDRDIRAALAHARNVAVPERDQLIHVIPTGYSIDRQRGILEPRGMTGQTLGVSSCAVTALNSSLRNIGAVTSQNRLEIDAYCAGAYAAGLACLVDDERQLGCTVIDMGGGTTSIAVFAEGKLVFTAAVPVGGNHVTSDIARGLTTSLADAERIKTLYGSAVATSPDDHTMIDVPPIGEEEHAQPNYVPRSLLTGIIQPRIEETFEMVRAKLVDSGFYQAAGRRVVLTGGASQLAGLCDIAQLILDKQVRLGRPHHVRGLAEATGGPAFATAAGLLLYAAQHGDEIPARRENFSFSLPIQFSWPFGAKGEKEQMADRGPHMLSKVTHWLKENW